MFAASCFSLVSLYVQAENGTLSLIYNASLLPILYKLIY